MKWPRWLRLPEPEWKKEMRRQIAVQDFQFFAQRVRMAETPEQVQAAFTEYQGREGSND